LTHVANEGETASPPDRQAPSWLKTVSVPVMVFLIRCSPAVAAIAGTLGLLTSHEGPGVEDKFGSGAWRLVGAALLVWLALALGRRLADTFQRACFTSWWDPAEVPDGDLNWENLKRLVEPDEDPMVNRGSLRAATTLTFLCRLVVILWLMFLCGRVAAASLAHPALPVFLKLSGNDRIPADALVNLSGNLTAFLALTAAVASIWFANSQLRSKVRADNRQEWLANARTLLGEVVALAREHAVADGSARASINELLDPKRLRFELMLNPREKDHRLLMHLLRRLAFLHEPDRAEAADGGAFLQVIGEHGVVSESDANGPRESKWKRVVDCKEPAQLTTYVMRLGHVVLKREWERVKATR
jgi:hypothetical protein